ncbi:SDR family oxidoreductase [Lignipirellula cremea]|uniref:Linear gramicidin synthase subunit D n=1 Tax=Lignipirellula cremea TaxID=2528010 RepID=A0A518DL46_9BACT|nr:SDR family oxidoreductase [Lignipirellula cremea]QDU92551.1 Linear gramicidin synthase subunit D [Lignipirellula cremea]
MGYLLLTGATGLLGRYLLRDLSLARIPLAVVVRPSRHETAAQRIETAIVYWERVLGRELVRPMVLSGDISQPGLGLSEEDLRWTTENCDQVLHSAASLTFYADDPSDPQGEPFRSNVQGTRHVLELCRQAGIRRYHQVSTAYVCGERRGRILESELDVGQVLGNDYEKTKTASEKEVRGADFLDQVTVHRPSIIVGDSQTGYTTSYHGFYSPLRLLHTLIRSVPWETIAEGDWLGGLSLDGSEHKNLVPVDWVSAAITEIVARPELHGHTYHLTNPHPSTVADMVFSIAAALAQLAEENPAPASGMAATEEMVASFREQMKIYQSYWSNDPDFDSTRTEAALPHLPCPAIDRVVMDRLIAFALQTNFGWPREATVTPQQTVQGRLQKWLAAGQRLPTGQTFTGGPGRSVNLEVCGRGGGQWRLLVQQEQLVGAQIGLGADNGLSCYLSADSFEQLAQGQLGWDRAIDSGRLVVAGAAPDAQDLKRLFSDLFSH